MAGLPWSVRWKQRIWPVRLIALCCGLVVLGHAAMASAFYVSDPLHKGCHERFTVEILRTLGHRGGAVPPPLTHEEAVFIDRQAFDARAYPQDMLAMALLLGNRSNDTAGYGSQSFINLAIETNGEESQIENCLRRRVDDWDEGNEQALRRCRDFIRREAEAALEGLSPDGSVDPLAVDEQPVFLPYHGTIKWPLSRFYYHAGRALHALQDSFSHTFRDASWHRVVAVTNWVDAVYGNFDERRDGPEHALLLDACDEQRPFRDSQLHAMMTASGALYRALLEAPASSRDASRAAIDAVLDEWLTYQAGCSIDNGYCGSAVYAEILADGTNGVSACNAHGGRVKKAARSAWGPIGLVLLGLGVAARLRRHRRLGLLLAVGLWLLPLSARASDAPKIAIETPAVAAPAPRSFLVHGFTRASGSLYLPGFAVAGGVLLSFRRVEAELGVEWNPFVSIDRVSIDAGALNIYLAGVWRWQVSPKVDITSGLGIGISVLLFETVGAGPGNVGPYVLVRPLGVTRHFGPRTAVTVQAFEVSAPVPQTRGWPLAFVQYRISVALRF